MSKFSSIEFAFTIYKLSVCLTIIVILTSLLDNEYFLRFNSLKTKILRNAKKHFNGAH